MPSGEDATVLAAKPPGLGKIWVALLVVVVLVGVVAWWVDGRLYATQAEIAKRLQAANTASIEARTLAKQSADIVGALNARIAVLESREQDFAAQRMALQQLYQDFAKSRDDAFLGQTAELIALGQQQAELTGSLSPLVSTLESSAVRLKRANSQRAQLVLRAVQVDLSRLKSSVAPDIPAAAQRLDELASLIDQLQTRASAAPQEGKAAQQHGTANDVGPVARGWAAWLEHWAQAGWEQVRRLVSITRIDHPEVLLMSPKQADYLRENLKLQVLNARLDLLSRNASGYRADMRAIVASLHNYFNTNQARAQMALTLARQAEQVDLGAQPAANLESLAALANLGLGSN
ncbi:MAG: hypothetical protein HIU89_12955 [Proteobacteria bacterium]|nr:hypothetical protein [Pseudomonadota bacterium]